MSLEYFKVLHVLGQPGLASSDVLDGSWATCGKLMTRTRTGGREQTPAT